MAKKSDLIDEKGHTVAQAEKHQRLFDPSAPAATEEIPEGTNTYVAAQTPEEVQAQIDNVPGEESDDDEDHDPDRS